MAKITEIIKPKKSSALRRLRVLLITVMLLLIPVLVYSTLYVSNQTDYFNNQNFRQLASISDQIAQRIEGLKIAFDNAIRNTLRKNQAGTPITFQQALGANFEMVDDTPIPKYATQKDMERDLADRKIEINLVTEGEARWLVFVCKLTPSGQDNPQQQSVTFRARTRLDDLVIPLIGSRKLESMKGSEHEGGFDAILIASLKEGSQNTRQQTQEQQQQDDRSKIIFQQGQPELDIASLDNLPRWDDPDKTVDFRNRSRSTSLVEVKLADSNYKLYMQPLNSLPKVSDGDKENQAAGTDLQAAPTRWVICGLVQSSHFRHETMAFSYTLLIIFAFAAAFIALSWPFLRLMFMGCKDRLRLADAYFIAFALLVGSAILTLFILYGFTYRHSENELDEQLKKFSDEINTHFSAEIDRATAEIDALNAKLDSNNLPGKVEVSKKSTNLEGQVNILGSIKDDTYPYFSKASWIDNIGCMKRQWTINGSTSDYICVSDRDYFKKLKEGSSRELNNQRFWLEPINSRLSGEKTVIVSKPIDNKDRKKMGESIVAIDPNMLALMHTVVPPGFGYRVIDISGNDPGDSDKDNPGKVIFQSSETEQQSENFFDECDNDHTLHSLIFGHRKGPVNLNYRGSDHSLYVSPMPGFPNWSLVVFRDKQVLRTVYLQTLALAGIIFLAYAAFFLVAFTIIYLIKINTRNRTEWIWPSREMSDVYYQTFFLNLVLCVVGIIIVSVSDGGLAIASISLIAFIGIFILGMMLKLRTSFKPLDSAVKFFRIKKLFGKGNAYVWNMVMLLILTGILPAAAFFKVAYNQEMRLFVKQEQINIAKEMAGREARIKREELERVESMNLRPLNIGEERDAGNLIDKRLDESLDVYEDFFFKTKHSFVDNGSLQKTRETNDGLVVLFASWVPIFNQTSLEQGGLIPTRAADESWEWLEPSGDLLPLYVPANQGSRPLYITTELQRLNVTPLFLVFLAVAFTLFLWTLFRLTRFVVRKIFLLDIDENLNLSKLPKDAAEITENHFVVKDSVSSLEMSFFKAGDFYPINVATESKVKGWVEAIDAQIKAGTLPYKVVVDNFDYAIIYPGGNNEKLKLIKTLLDAKKLVVIMSSCEPADCSFGKATNGKAATGEENGFKTQHNGLDGQWVEIISHFKKVYYFEKDDAELERAIAEVEISFNAKSDLSKRSRNRFKQLLQLVRQESAPQEFLQEVCVKIIKQDGFENMEPDSVTAQILEQAQLYYQKIWDDCSEGEKLTLLHLAQDRFLSPNDIDIKPLLQRGLIKRDPDIRFMTESFKQFVQSQSLSGGLESIETLSRRTSPWEALRVPLLIIFVGVLLFLFLTQKNFYNSSLTLVTALTTSIPAFFKLLGLFQGDGSGSKA